MAYEDLTDIGLDFDGDLAIDESGDLLLTEGVDTLADDVRVRLLSASPELADCDGVCANLEDLIGKMNTRTTAEEMVSMVVQALTSDGRLSMEDIEVLPIPAPHALYAHIEITLPEQTITYLMDLNLQTGLVNLQRL